jgi:hypothetical protein
MSEAARAFWREFVENTVNKAGAVPYPENRAIAKPLAELAIGDAEKRGITRRELQEAAGGSLPRRISELIEDAYDAELKANASEPTPPE